MLKDLSRYQNLGTPNYYKELFDSVLDDSDDEWSIPRIRELFFNRVIDGRIVFDGCLPFLAVIGIINVGNSGKVDFVDLRAYNYVSVECFTQKLAHVTLRAFKFDSDFQSIFSAAHISYDLVEKKLLVDNAAFGFKHSSFKQLLLDFGVLHVHKRKGLGKYLVNPEFLGVFDEVVLPELRRRRLGVEEFRVQMERNQRYGLEAEEYVLNFEKERLNGLDGVDWVAKYSVAEGYDIASYNSPESRRHDRFIEVKSFGGRPHFYWSRNEINTARIKGAAYHLYLVDRAKMNLPDYAPIIVQNPYEAIYVRGNGWRKKIESTRFDLM